MRAVIGGRGRRLDAGPLPLVLALVAVAALLVAAIVTSTAFRDERRQGASASRDSPATGSQVPPGWTALPNPAGAYTLAYPPGWRASARSDAFHTTNVSGPGGRLFKVQSSSSPSDPMQAWTAQERGFRGHPGYQRIRLEPGRYQGLDAAIWEFTQLEGGRRVHKLDITFKSADGRWGYAVLLQAPESAWSDTLPLSGQFERAFTPTG